MFTVSEFKELARACRSLAYLIEQTAEAQKGTSVHAATLDEMLRFRSLAQKCEGLSAKSGAPS